MAYLQPCLLNLSTPHGTLGTNSGRERSYSYKESFNSTRYIRNPHIYTYQLYAGTPFNSTRYIRNSGCGEARPKGSKPFNSTRYIRNTEVNTWTKSTRYLSTPHGTLGTKVKAIAFPHRKDFQLHTVHQEPQTTTLTKIRHINHFVNRAPLSNEVNFPKSEIMQS